MIDEPDLLSLSALEPFGWVFTPGSVPDSAVSNRAARQAAGVLSETELNIEVSVTAGRYTEKGRYREELGGRRVTLYLEHPVWVVTVVRSGALGSSEAPVRAEQYSGHTVVDASTGEPITKFLQLPTARQLPSLALHEPIAAPTMSEHMAINAALSGEERFLKDLPRTAAYGARWRLIPGFVQVTDVWHVTFDTSNLPPMAETSRREVAWVVVVDDKAGHRWLSAALEEPNAG